MSAIPSRYQAGATATLLADGREIIYLRRRFLPAAVLTEAEHAVVQGDRLDHIAARYLGASELFWQLCDANDALNPADLDRPAAAGCGLRLRIPAIMGG